MTPKEELLRVAREQAELMEAMARSIWGDRLALAMTAAALGGFGIGLLFSERWAKRYLGALCYATAAGLELYVAMSAGKSEPHVVVSPEAESRAA